MNEIVKKEPVSQVSLRQLMTPSKTVEFDYPSHEGFKVSLCYLAREELVKLRTRCVSQVFNRKTRAYEEQMDDNKFLAEYTKAVIKGWSGLKMKYLRHLLLVGDIEDEEATLPWNNDNCETLMKNSADFDTWVTDMVGDLEHFTKSK